MNAEEFVAALRQELLVDHLASYQHVLRESKKAGPDPLAEWLDDDDDDEPRSSVFLASLTPEQEAGYLAHVRAILMSTTAAVLSILDGEHRLGGQDVGFRLIPGRNGGDIAGELNEIFVRLELAGTEFAVAPPAQAEAHGDGTADAEIDAEEFVDRVREVLFDEQLPRHAQLVEDIARTAQDRTTPGRAGRQLTFLESLDDEQRAAYLTQVRAVINDTGANILGILDGETATRGDYLEFAVVPPGGGDISGDLQELFLIADEDGPFGADPGAGHSP